MKHIRPGGGQETPEHRRGVLSPPHESSGLEARVDAPPGMRYPGGYIEGWAGGNGGLYF